jgi:hypothetical protein
MTGSPQIVGRSVPGGPNGPHVPRRCWRVGHAPTGLSGEPLTEHKTGEWWLAVETTANSRWCETPPSPPALAQ